MHRICMRGILCAHSNTFSSYLGYHLSLDEDTKGQRLGGLPKVIWQVDREVLEIESRIFQDTREVQDCKPKIAD